MKRGFSPTKSKVNGQLSNRRDRDEVRRPTNPSVNYWKYFCHYNNAVYQGGMNAYKKHGKGLLLHDDGAAVITQYLHDSPSGHNIIFRDNSIASVLFKSTSEYQIAYKLGKCIIKIPFTDNSEKAHGVGVLIDYQTFKIYELIFKRGTLVDKILHLNRKNNDDAFKFNTIAKLVGLKHEQAFDLSFEKPQTMHVKYDHNQLLIGFYDDNGEAHGLAFKMYAENVQISGQKSLYLKSIERGYYKHSKLQTYGQKYFSNGNKYIGQFEKGQFHGYGILLCPQEMKWVYGRFIDGKLSQVIDSNNKRYTENKFQMWNESLLDIHKRYRERWIDFSIELPEELYLYNVLMEALKKPVTEVDPDYQEAVKEDEYRMTKIQQQFLEGYPGDTERSYVQAELDKHYTVKSNRTPRGLDSSLKNRPRIEESPIIKRYQTQDPKNDKIRIQTPSSINKFQEKYTPKHSSSTAFEERRAEKDYRMKDPFQIELIKVPYDQKPQIREKVPEYQPKQPYRKKEYQEQIKPYEGKYPKEQVRRYPDEIERKVRYQGPYRRSHMDELEKQKQIFKRLEREDEEYINYLRNGISRSPVHRNYYNTPPRYDPTSTRYNGKIINKKTFNYRDPTESYRDSPGRRYPTTREEVNERDLREPEEIPRSNRKSPYKSSPRNLQSLNSSKNFIENNYRQWR